MEPPSVWGPKVWKLLEQTAVNYPISPSEARKAEARHFLTGLPSLLPCNTCADHLRTILTTTTDPALKFSSAVKNRDHFFYFVWSLHDQVNKAIGKRGITYAQAIKKYNSKI